MNEVTVTMPREYWEQVVKCIDIALAPKPLPKPDKDIFRSVSRWESQIGFVNINCENLAPNNLVLIFDGHTGKLKDAKVIK